MGRLGAARQRVSWLAYHTNDREYDFENTARPTLADVPDQWCFDAWYEHDTILCKRFDKLR